MEEAFEREREREDEGGPLQTSVYVFTLASSQTGGNMTDALMKKIWQKDEGKVDNEHLQRREMKNEK